MPSFFSQSIRAPSVKRWVTKGLHKITKLLPCLAISPEASVNKPKRKRLTKKSPPECVKPLRTRRSSDFIEKLDTFCWGPKVPNGTQPTSKRPRPKTPEALILEQQKRVLKSRVTKKNGNKLQQKKCLKRLKKILTNLNDMSVLFGKPEPLSCPPSPTSFPVEMEWEPLKRDPLAPSLIYKGKNGRLRGPDSKFADPNFDASIRHIHPIDAETAQQEVHQEVKQRAQQQAQQQELAQPSQTKEVEMADVLPVDHQTPAAIELSPQQRTPATIIPAPPPVASLVMPFVHPVDIPPQQPAHVNLNVAALPLLSSSRGCQHKSPAASQQTTASSKSSHDTVTIFSLPPPNSSRGCQRPTQPAKAAISPIPASPSPPSSSSAAPPNSGNNTFTIAANPPPTSSHGCQPKTLAQANAASAGAAVGKGLTAPAGARRAVPMNLVIGESKSNSSSTSHINSSLAQPHSDSYAASTAQAGTSGEIMEGVADRTLLPASPRPIILKLKLSTVDDKKQQMNAQLPAINIPATWQPRSWDRKEEDIRKCGTWKKQSCPEEWKSVQQETLVPDDGVHDKDLEKVKNLVDKLNDHNTDSTAIKKIVSSTVHCCMNQDNVEVPIEKPEHVLSIPKLAAAPPGSTVVSFKVKSKVLTDKKREDFEDDMIDIQHKQPAAWEWLIGFVIQRGCSLEQLLVTTSMVEKEGRRYPEKDSDIFDEIIGKSQWTVDWRRVDDLVAIRKTGRQVITEKFYEATDLVGIARQDLMIVFKMIKSGGYFETFADQVKQWALTHRQEFFRMIRKAGLCLEVELEELVAVKKWLWKLCSDEHEDFLTNMEECLQSRYRHWYERYGEEEGMDSGED